MNPSATLRLARNTLAGSTLLLLALNCGSPSGSHPNVDPPLGSAASSNAGTTGTGGAGNGTGSGGAQNSGGGANTGNTSGVGNTGNTSGVGNTGNTGGSGNTGNTGGVGNTGNTGNTGGNGNTGNTGGVGNTGNTGNTGGNGNTGNTGGSGNTGNTGGVGNTGNTGGSGNTGNFGNVDPPPDIQGGQQAWASRYWDCCKPACGWTGNTGGRTPISACDINNNSLGGNYDARNACENGGEAYMCWSGAPWAVGDRLSYGFAAASGGNYTCGRCFHLQFTGSGHHGSSNTLSGKHMIVQVINNGGVESDQFDLLIPGGGVGALNACSRQWGTDDLGAQYGGFLAGCNGNRGCVEQKCQQVFGDKPELAAGCSWFLGWFNMADNPNVLVERIPCPAAITQRSGLSDPG